MEDRHVTRAASPLKLGDKEFRVRALDDQQVDDLNEWLRSEFIKMCRKSVVGLKPSEYEREMGIVYAKSAELDWRGGRGAQLMSNPAGFSRILWMMTRSDHPDLDHKTVYDLLEANPDRVKEAVELFKHVNNVKVENEGEEPPHPE